MQLTKQPSSGGPPLPQALWRTFKDYSTKSGLIWARLARFGEFLPLWVLCTVSVLGLGAVAEKGRVITVTVDTIDSVITIGAVVTSIGIVIAMVRRRRMTTRVVSFPWSIPSVSSEAFSFVPNWKYFWGFYDKCDYFDDDYCTHPWDTQRRQILWQRRPEQKK